MESTGEDCTPYYTGYTNDNPTLFIPLTIANPYNEKKAVHCSSVVDTGFNGTLLITSDLKDRLGFRPATFPFKHIERYSEMVDSGVTFKFFPGTVLSCPVLPWPRTEKQNSVLECPST